MNRQDIYASEHRLLLAPILVVALLSTGLIQSCTSSTTANPGTQSAGAPPIAQSPANSNAPPVIPPTENAPTETLDDAQAIQAQEEQAYKREVTVKARVLKLLRDDTEGLPHQRFLLVLTNNTTVLIAHDLKMAPRVPIEAGDVVTVHGEYIWNKKGGVIHWTHHTDTPRHVGGWIDFNGERYQ